MIFGLGSMIKRGFLIVQSTYDMLMVGPKLSIRGEVNRRFNKFSEKYNPSKKAIVTDQHTSIKLH